jgi:GR25 family glycosyltransferase involved in LPS biosynthesis
MLEMTSILNRVFDAVFVINLDRAPDRLKKIDEELRRLGIRYHRIQAVDGKALSPEEVAAATTWGCSKFCTKGAIGCALSHRKVWQTTVEQSLGQVLVLEDDAHFGPNFEARFQKAWSSVPDDWDFVYIGCTTGCGDRKRYTFFDWGMTGTYMATRMVKEGQLPRLHAQINEHITVPDSASATHAYAITAHAAAKLLQRMERVSGIGHVDQLITYRHGRDLKKYAFMDGSLITQSMSFDGSLIGTGGSPYLGNRLLDMFQLNHRGVRGGWMMSEPIIRLGDVQVAGWQFIFIALGWLLGLKRLRIFAIAMLLDSVLIGGKIDWKTLVFNVALFGAGAYARRRVTGSN